ncbi:MAG: ribosome maturation factor RimM [Acidimicrobiales bacterium]
MLEVGFVVKPHGLRGEVVVDLVSNRPEVRLAAGSVLSTDDGPLEVVASRPHQGRWIVTFAGVEGCDGAEGLRGRVLSADAQADDDDVLWVHELIGSRVVDVGGIDHGPVEAVEANPASDLLVLSDGRLVPLTFVVERRPDGTVIVDPPAGLLDD